MLGKSTTFIFCSEIPYGESINVVIFFCSNLFFFSRKYSKTVTSAHRHKMTETKATSMATTTLLLRSAKVSRPFSNLDICKGGIKAGFHLKAVFMSFNVAFVPISRSRFKQCQIAPLRTFTNVLRFCVNFWMIFGHSVNEIFFLKG